VHNFLFYTMVCRNYMDNTRSRLSQNLLKHCLKKCPRRQPKMTSNRQNHNIKVVGNSRLMTFHICNIKFRVCIRLGRPNYRRPKKCTTWVWKWITKLTLTLVILYGFDHTWFYGCMGTERKPRKVLEVLKNPSVRDQDVMSNFI
jgi:hypothetical protein